MENKYLGLTPPMGWNSWNTFTEDINEDVVKQSADAMVESGLKDAGYEYVVIDDCWSLRERGADGRIVPDPKKFPSGMKAVADYVHSKGLKFGMYSCDGPLTCAGYPGSFDNEFVDAATFAEWGVDYLKYDNCFKPRIDGNILYRRMSMALRNCGRDILFSACNWGAESSERWMRSTGAHIYRSTGDIRDSWQSIRSLALSQINKIAYSGSYCFNDIDMLVVGMYGKSTNEYIANAEISACTDLDYRTHFALWCMMNSPLMIGCDIRNMTEATVKTLTNKDLIAINQDIEGRSPYYLYGHPNTLGAQPEEPRDHFWLVRALSNGDIALGAFNLSDKKRTLSAEAFDIGLPATTGKCFDAYECVNQQHIGKLGQTIQVKLEAHDCVIYRCKVVDL